MSTVEERIEQIQKPGHGYGWGCTVVARREGVTAGVAWTRITVVQPRGQQEREQVYMTESGHQVEPVTGSYGSGVRWSVTGPGVKGDMAATRVAYATNLTKAFTTIARAQAATEESTNA